MATPPDSNDTLYYSNTTNLSSSSPDMPTQRPLYPGIYAPTPCFFYPNEDIDTDTIATHAVRLAHAGLAGLTVQGSNGEAVHLSHAERNLVTRTTRLALDNAGFPHMPIIVGCGAQSTRETIELCRGAAEAGGDAALILPPAYFKASYTREALKSYFTEVSSESPIPIIIYNYPGAAAGTDLDSEFLIDLADHANFAGVKLTCGNVGKLARVAASTNAPNPISSAISPSSFLVLAGSADFLLGSLSSGASGALAGLANIAPKSCVALQQAYARGDMKRAQQLQAILARADWVVQKGGVVGTKAALESWFGYGGFARAPLPRLGKDDAWKNRAGFEEIVRLESSL